MSDSPKTGTCMFCFNPGKKRASAGEGGIAEDAHACDPCWRLLQNPATALRLIRGNLSGATRYSGDDKMAKGVDAFMERIAGWKPRN